MKLIIDGCEVEIRVKRVSQRRYTEQETMYFLNSIAAMAGDAKERREQLGFNAIAAEARRVMNDIHGELERKGLYD